MLWLDGGRINHHKLIVNKSEKVYDSTFMIHTFFGWSAFYMGEILVMYTYIKNYFW